MDKRKICAVVLGGGKGSRMHSEIQKQYLMLNGRPLIVYALETFAKSRVDQIILVVGQGEEEFAKHELIEKYHIGKVSAVVAGGKERYHSVYQGLLACGDCDYVLIHDGARPMVTNQIIEAAICGAANHQACVVAVPVKDTIKVADASGFAKETPDRSALWQVQTPQAFSYPLIRSAYDEVMADENLQKGITDDAMVVEKTKGIRVEMIEGSYRNIKVTTPEDMVIAEAFLKMQSGC